MKHLNLLFAFLLIIILSACQKTEKSISPAIENSLVIITGHFENVTNIDSLSNIGIYAKDYVTQETFTTEKKLDSTTKFKFKFSITKPQDVMLLYNGIISLIVEPGDSIYLVLNVASKFRKDILLNMKISGTNADINQDLNDYHINDPIDYDSLRARKRSLAKPDFKRYKDSIYQEQSKYIDQLLIANNYSEMLKNWLTAEKLFGLASTFNFTSYTNTEDTSQDSSGNKFFIGDLHEIKEEHLINTKISNKVSSDISDFYALKNLNENRKLKDGWERNTIIKGMQDNPDNSYLSILIANHVMQTSLNNSSTKAYDDNKPLIDSILGDTYFKFHFQQKYDNVIELLENPIENKNIKTAEFQSSQASGIIDEIVENAKGKVIYIDHWGTWCAPCINEFKESTPALVNKLHKDVEFIYMCYKSEEEQWKATISKFQLEGIHYFINDELIGDMRQLFAIEGFPTYTIINKKGEIIRSSSVYRSGNPETEKLLNSLVE